MHSVLVFWELASTAHTHVSSLWQIVPSDGIVVWCGVVWCGNEVMVGVALLDIVTIVLDTPCFLWSLVQKKNTSKIYSAL